MTKLDDNADVAIKDIDDIIKFSHKFLSFDEKLKKLYNKTLETTGYLFKRTKQYQKIKTKIELIYFPKHRRLQKAFAAGEHT